MSEPLQPTPVAQPRTIPPKQFSSVVVPTRIEICTSPLGRYREVLFHDAEEPDRFVGTGYLKESERRELARMLREVIAELEREIGPKETAPEYDWWVDGTGLMPPVIGVVCRKTGVTGYVENYTRAEWNQAFSAPSQPYAWTDASRVIIAGTEPVAPEEEQEPKAAA